MHRLRTSSLSVSDVGRRGQSDIQPSEAGLTAQEPLYPSDLLTVRADRGYRQFAEADAASKFMRC